MIASGRKITTEQQRMWDFTATCRVPKIRTMREFSEQEIVIPSGEYEGLRFKCGRQPFASLWFDSVDSGSYSELVITGPSQSGKTLIGFIIPILYHLFELGETVIAAVPDMEMVRDKWEQDLEPVLRRTRYWALMPRNGAGSKGGRVEFLQFGNGAILRFMTAGGSDKSRAGFTSRVVCMTETDGFDVRTSTSEEADKIQQIEARTRSFPLARRRIYKECTLSTDQGHTWVRYQAGTASRILLPCPHCDQHVAPERSDFRGWEEAENETAAVAMASFYCPACGEQWTEDQRAAANAQALLVHRGQTIEGGQVVGEPPETRTLGFRWSAVNNLLVPAGDVGLDEWRSVRSADEDNEERKLCQFVWAVPYKPKFEEMVSLTPEAVKDRTSELGRGQFPADSIVTVGVDVNKRVLHWTAIAWDDDGCGLIFDYGKTGTKADELGIDRALVLALKHLRDRFGVGWSSNRVDRVLVDCRWPHDEVVSAVRSLKDKRFRPFMGLGLGHFSRMHYRQPVKPGREVIWVGTQCYEKYLVNQKSIVMFGDANYWKTWLHQRLQLPLDDETKQPDGVKPITLFASADVNEHMRFAKHLTAEHEIQTFEPGKGYVRIWDAIRSENHWLDATYMACVAAHRMKVATHEVPKPTQGVITRVITNGGAESPVGQTFTAPTFTYEV